MSLRIAVVGKGGTGKTTLSSLLCRGLVARKVKPVLAVDADPNSCLAERLGVRVDRTIGELREMVRRDLGAKPVNLSKNEWIDRLITESIAESAGMDLIVMGRQEGPDCYCFINNLLREFLVRMGRQYAAVVIDNEAGLEHISRRTDGRVEAMLVTCLPTMSGARTAVRIVELVKSLKLDVGYCGLVLNQSDGRLSLNVEEELRKTGLETLGVIPADPQVADLETAGKALDELPADSPAAVAADELLGKILERSKT